MKTTTYNNWKIATRLALALKSRAEVFWELGTVYRQNGNLDMAEECFKEAKKIATDSRCFADRQYNFTRR
jgi:hypothetical protein